ncbi:BMP family ABC transporter substrate-binding protein, partial [Amycolatopsis lurida]|uniref:BMP family ABC transporter substrate-binding protein n=1 Tax=Amycolatopsis lurida TaxID=31959 RepID=UPI00364C9F4C
ELHRTQLAEYDAIERRDFPPAPDRPREDRLRHIVLRAGIELETFWTTWLTPAGDFSGFQDPAKGNVKAAAQIAKGADVIYHAAGASGKGVFEAAKSNNAMAIGVDSDQYNQKTVEASKDVIITSMLKRVDVAVFDYLRALAKGDLTTLPKRFDLKVDGIGYATSGGKVDDIKDVLDGYKAQIVSGAITVSDKPQK